uniref:Apolipoprotein A-II n=1 Tax=Poecilia formosa TaxID=48698 RepID=A0A096MHB0_POEFO
MTFVCSPPYIISSRCELWFTGNSPPEKTVTSWICTSSNHSLFLVSEMNTKLVLALVFALQVSMSLSQVPAPSQELVDKYESLKATFYRRLVNAYGKLQGTVGQTEQAQTTREFIESLRDKPELQAVAKVASGLGAEAAPVVDRARASLLGLYEQYLRPHVGNGLSEAIDQIKVYLDQYMPAE